MQSVRLSDQHQSKSASPAQDSIRLELQSGMVVQPSYTAGNDRPEIDGLRAIAMLAVIANHVSEHLLPSGYMGVDIFFVISGYVISLSLSNPTSTSFRSFAAGFFKRRMKKLVPVLFICVVITAIPICYLNDRTATLSIQQSYLLSASQITNKDRSRLTRDLSLFVIRFSMP
ncbi:MAG: acyltransferase family protein [Cyanobacteriota bacterium]